MNQQGETLNDALHRFNQLPAAEAEAELFKCCGSARWGERMAGARPFADARELFDAADRIWWTLDQQDWLEAFRSHPQIGEKKAQVDQQATARRWSEQEQSGTGGASSETMRALAEGNRIYEEKFGYIYIVCATGKTSDEMLAILNARLHNDADAELRVAAEEQRRITELRLQKLLKSLGVWRVWRVWS